MKKIALVTGGAGFIGSHLCELLITNGWEVWSLDNYFTGSVNNHVSGVNYIQGETKDIKTLITCVPHVVFHLGEYSRVEQSFKDVDLVWRYNREPIIEVINFTIACDAKLVYAGSSTKFGDDGEARNQSPYAWSKASNTELIESYSRWFGLKYATTYFYNVYGPREISHGKYATLIAIFRERMLQKKPLEVVLPGTQTRNFTHVSDIVKGVLLVAEKGKGDNYGIGNETAYSVTETAKMFGGPIKMLPERKGNRLSAPINTKKIRELGWHADYQLDEYIEYARSQGWTEV